MIWTVKLKPLKYPRRKCTKEHKEQIHQLYDQYRELHNELLTQFQVTHRDLYEAYQESVKGVFNEQHSVSGGGQEVPEDKLLAGNGEDQGLSGETVERDS